MAYPVKAEFEHAFRLVSARGAFFFESPDNETLAPMVAAILIREKGYPDDTVVEINGLDPMAMALVVDADGTWELV